MKKLLSLALALLMLASVATVALASTTTLTTTVPPATYTLNIPADQEIPFGETGHNIGNVTVTDAAGFAEGKNLKVTMDMMPLPARGYPRRFRFLLSVLAAPMITILDTISTNLHSAGTPRAAFLIALFLALAALNGLVKICMPKLPAPTGARPSPVTTPRPSPSPLRSSQNKHAPSKDVLP